MKKYHILIVSLIIMNCISCQNERQKFLTEANREINKFCPATVDITTRIDKSEVYNDSTLKLSHTCLLDLSDTNMKDMAIREIKDHKPLQIQTLKSLKPFDGIKKNKIYFIYSYYDLQQNHLCDIIINPQEYLDETYFSEERYLIDMLKKESEEAKKNLPVVLSDGSVLICCDFIEDAKTLEYAYVVPKDLLITVQTYANENNTSPENLLKQSLLETIKQEAKGIERNMELGFIYRYKYYDERGKLLHSIIIDKNNAYTEISTVD